MSNFLDQEFVTISRNAERFLFSSLLVLSLHGTLNKHLSTVFGMRRMRRKMRRNSLSPNNFCINILPPKLLLITLTGKEQHVLLSFSFYYFSSSWSVLVEFFSGSREPFTSFPLLYLLLHISTFSSSNICSPRRTKTEHTNHQHSKLLYFSFYSSTWRGCLKKRQQSIIFFYFFFCMPPTKNHRCRVARTLLFSPFCRRGPRAPLDFFPVDFAITRESYCYCCSALDAVEPLFVLPRPTKEAFTELIDWQ